MDSWDDCSGEVQAKIIAFDQVASHDEAEQEAQLAGARTPMRSAAPSPKGRAATATPARDAARAARASKKGKKAH